ncbi:hypothetical protein NE237_021758 [Protea cynaroides]|uniref:Glycosyltransferase n=1 Tax=Protea cynaroides TaxID=273540 RepID=A0A9Q0K565_9MAGN|nr:hypothetical protein NE237_021758 [Protea cynaroides]
MVELGKLILEHCPSLSVTILITPPPLNTGSTGPYMNRISSTTPSITFHHLPAISISHDSISSPHHEALIVEVVRRNNPNVYKALLSISKISTIQAFIVDMFCTTSLDVAASFNLPIYHFYTSGAAALCVMLYFPTMHKNTTESFKELGSTLLDFPGVPSIPACDMVKPILDRNDDAYHDFLDLFSRMSKSNGIIINTFESLEPRAVKALSSGLSIPDRPTPPIYCIGPVIAADDRTGGHGNKHECLTWLDSQPSRSVVFLCFGSLGLFSAAQLKEIAVGLERSGLRFLWVVRNPLVEDKSWRHLAPPEPDLEALLPEGFLERTKDRGFVVKLWAPQKEVLSQKAVGGFVTHCGWNSVLESVWAGVPMVAWPLYAEQRLNRIFMVEEMKIALPMNELENGFVYAAEVEKRVRGLMESEEGKAVRARTIAMRDAAVAATTDDSGSSRVSFAQMAESWKSAN